MTDEQKEALKIVLELYKEDNMTDEQVLVVIGAIIENNTTHNALFPYTPTGTGDNPFPLVTYKSLEEMKLT